VASKFSLEALRPELGRVLFDRTIVTERLSVQDAYLLMQACQLTITHPNLHKAHKDLYRALGRRMQELMRPHTSEFFSEFCEAGWNREFDE